MADDERPQAGGLNRRTGIIILVGVGAGALLYVLVKRRSTGPTADTTSSGGVAPGYGSQLGDLIQFSPSDQGGGQSGGPGGVTGGASGGGMLPPHTLPPGWTPPIRTRPAQPVPFAGPGGVSSPALINPIRLGPPAAGVTAAPVTAQAPLPYAAPTPTRPQQTVPGRLPAGINVVNARTLGILGPTQSRPAPVVVAGSVPPRNLPAGLSVNNAKRLGL